MMPNGIEVEAAVEFDPERRLSRNSEKILKNRFNFLLTKVQLRFLSLILIIVLSSSTTYCFNHLDSSDWPAADADQDGQQLFYGLSTDDNNNNLNDLEDGDENNIQLDENLSSFPATVSGEGEISNKLPTSFYGNSDNDDVDNNNVRRSALYSAQDGQAIELDANGEIELSNNLLHKNFVFNDDGQEGESLAAAATTRGINDYEIFLLEDKDYPKSLFEDYSRKVGQVSGITTLPTNDVVIFHRAERQWKANSEFPIAANGKSAVGNQTKLLSDQLIHNDTLMIIDGENGSELFTFGKSLFYMPHSVASDSIGNIWVSDVGRHQVMRLPLAKLMNFQRAHKAKFSRSGEPAAEVAAAATKEALITFKQNNLIEPDLILGQPFAPGQDWRHFCQPSEIAISSNGHLVFIADGYCNNRVVVYTSEGQYLTEFGQEQQMQVVHSLTLFEERNLICVADRENGRIFCYRAGLNGNLSTLGELVHQLNYPIGKIYALTSISPDHLLVSSNQNATNRYNLAILNPFKHELKLVWTSSDLLEPHSLARTLDKQYAYAADVSRDAFKKVFKFDIITKRN